MDIATKLKKLRTDHNLTQAELGEIAGVSDKAVSTWERGTAEPRMGCIERLAAYFHMAKSEFYEEDIELTKEEKNIIRITRTLSEEEMKMLKDYYRLIAAAHKSDVIHKIGDLNE